MIYDDIAERLAKACECDIDDILGPGEEADLDTLTVLGVPDSVVEFYREYAPLDTIDIGDNRLWTIPHMMAPMNNIIQIPTTMDTSMTDVRRGFLHRLRQDMRSCQIIGRASPSQASGLTGAWLGTKWRGGSR